MNLFKQINVHFTYCYCQEIFSFKNSCLLLNIFAISGIYDIIKTSIKHFITSILRLALRLYRQTKWVRRKSRVSKRPKIIDFSKQEKYATFSETKKLRWASRDTPDFTVFRRSCHRPDQGRATLTSRYEIFHLSSSGHPTTPSFILKHFRPC